MNNVLIQLGVYTLLAIFTVPIAIVSHEIGHYLCYLYLGAEEVRLHAFSVSADTQKLPAAHIAIANMAGPAISYFTIFLAVIMTKKQYSAFWVMLALSAPIGRLVNGVYIYFRILGYQPKPNFDEYNFSTNMKLDPAIVSVLTMLIVLATFYFFGRLAWKHKGFWELFQVVLSILLGLIVWTQTGPMLLS